MKARRAGDLFALSCAISCGLGNIPAKSALEKLSPEVFNFYMFVFAWIFSSFTLLGKENRKEIASPNPKILALIFFLAVAFAVALSFSMTGLKMLQPATASFMSRFEVVLTVTLAYMVLKEKLSVLEILGGMIALGGLFILKYKTNMVISQGATMMVLSALFFASSEIIVKKNISKIGTASFLFYRSLFLIPILFVIVLIRRQKFILPDFKTLLLVALAALLLPVIGRATYQMAMKRIDISRAALISQSTPIFTAIFAFLILSAFPSPIEWLGGGLIIAGVVIVKLSEGRLQRLIANGVNGLRAFVPGQ